MQSDMCTFWQPAILLASTTRPECRIARLSPSAIHLALVALLAVFWSIPVVAQNGYAPPKQETLTPTGVSLVDGRFTFQNDDFSIGSLTLTRFHQGGKPKVPSRSFSDSWSNNFDIYVVDTWKTTTENTYVKLGRNVVTFTWGNYAGYLVLAPESAGTSLTDSNGTIIYTDRDYNVYTFNPSVRAVTDGTVRRSQKISSIVYANGRRLDFYYTNEKLTLVKSSDGFAVAFELNADGNVSAACGFNLSLVNVSNTPSCAGAPVSTHYSYSQVGMWKLLTQYTDPLGHLWSYDYVQDNGIKLSCVHIVDSSQCRIQNFFGEGQKPSQVARQTLADGAQWTYNFVGLDPDNPPQPGQPFPWTTGGADGPEGVSMGGAFTLGFLLFDSTVNGRRTTFTYDGVQLTGVQYPEGDTMTYGYTSFGNLASVTHTPKLGSGLSAVTMSRSFPDSGSNQYFQTCTSPAPRLCSKPIYSLDYNGNRTDYTWDTNSGLPLTETGPADANGVRPVKRSAYVQRYAWVSNGAGGYVQATAPIWLLASEKTCRTTSTSGDACVGGSADETITTYDYGPDSGPNNLLLRGIVVSAGGTSRRTCYGYDAMGNRIWEVRPRAGLTSCPAN